MSLPQDINASASPEVQMNENFQSLSWAFCFGNDPRGNSGLVRRYSGGRWSGLDIVDTDITFGASATSYVVAAVSDGAITSSTSTTNWNNDTDYARIEKVVSGASTIDPDDVEDHRGGAGGVHGGTGAAGGGGGGTELQGLTFTSDTGSTADSDPGNGLMKWNNGTQASATILYFDNQTLDSVSLTTFFAALVAGGFLYMQQSDDASRWQMWKIVALTAGSGYYKVSVTLEAKGADIEDDKTVFCDFRGGAIEVWAFACSDRVTALTTGTNSGSMHAPYAANVLEVQAGLDTAQTSGSIFTVDVNEAGATILSTKLTIDNTEDTSISAATPAVISDNQVAKGAKISADIDQVGDGTAKGLVVYLLVSRR